uniref:Rab-GAP TBC domain-containing protein n=1 Tax=Phytophthora ramorum TaxID=164328 RepID=H3GW27_PHYRM
MALRYGDDMGLEERALFLTERLAALDQVKEWKHVIKTELAQPQYSVDQVRPSTTLESPLMFCLLEKTGLLGLIKRTVIDLHCEATQTVAAASKKQVTQTTDDGRLLPETKTANGCSLDVVRAARDNWEKITSDEMLKVAKELGRPFVAPKVIMTEAAARDDGQAAGPPAAEAEGTKPSKPNKVLAARFLYDGSLSRLTGCMSRQTQPPTLGRNAFLAEKNRVGDLVLAHQSVSMARQYSKTGCPVSLRPQDRSYFEYLKSQAAQWTYLTDGMYLLDLQQTIDSSDYFVFQDHLESVLMAFTRDTYVKEHALQVNGAVHCSLSEAGPLQASGFQPDGTAADDTDRRLPPNGVLPFSGLVMYMAPLAYLYADPVEIYYVFRELYTRYWSKLNAIRTERGTILPLCKAFEDLVVRSSPAAVFHLINIGLKPLDIAFPWIQSAFSGVLDIDQVLLLWDRVIGYDSLELLAIFAAALFHFRASELELVNTREEADELFAELIDIPVVTLLQDYLFGLQ